MKGNQNQLKKQYEMCVCVRYEGRILHMQEHNNKGHTIAAVLLKDLMCM